MGPLFNSMAELTQGFAAASQSPYRAAMQGGQPTVYTIDPSGHSAASTGRFVASIVAATSGGSGTTDTQHKTISLFNTDPHSMSDSVGVGGSLVTLPSSSTPSQTSGYGGRGAATAAQHAAPANPYAGLPTNYVTGVAGNDRYTNKNILASGEPPPAHSGSRPNAASRTAAYQTQPVVQHSQTPATTAQSASTRSIYTPVEQRSSVETNAPPPTAHNNLQRPGDDLMQKLLLTYNRGQAAVAAQQQQQQSSSNRGSVGGTSSYASSSPVQSRAQHQQQQQQQQQTSASYGGGQQQRAGSSYQQQQQNFSIGSPMQQYAAAATGYGQPSDDVMDDIPYDDVSSPEGMGLPDAAATLAGSYLAAGALGSKAASSIGSDAAARHMAAAAAAAAAQQSCSAAQRQSVVLGRIMTTTDPTIQAQADSTTKPKKSSGSARSSRAAAPGGETATAKRNRNSSSRSRAKGKGDEEMQHAEIGGAAVNAAAVAYSAAGGVPGSAAYAQLLAPEFSSVVGPGYDAFAAQYRIGSDPYQSNECMITQASRPDLTHRMAAAPLESNVVQQEAQVFMTNMFGSAFVNPNELMSVEQIAFVDPNEPNASAGTSGYGQPIVPKPDPKHRPIIEEEFGHLASDPTTAGGVSSEQTAAASGAGVTTPGSIQTSSTAGGTASTTATTDSHKPSTSSSADEAADKNQSAFMDSFMSFLQGKKPETLASVSTSVPVKKPVLPKYIPEPPRPKPPPPPPVTHHHLPTSKSGPSGSSSSMSSKTGLMSKSGGMMPGKSSFSSGSSMSHGKSGGMMPGKSALKSGGSASGKSGSKSDAIVVHFSDDEDDTPLSKRVGSAVNKALQSLKSSKNTNNKSSPSGKPRGRPPLSKSTPSKQGSSGKFPPKKAKLQPQPRVTKNFIISDDDDDDADVVMLDSPALPLRERKTRKAKEVAVQKGRSHAQKGP